MLRPLLLCLILAPLLALGPSAAADIVEMNDGHSYNGRIVEETTTSVTIQLSRTGRITLQRDQIKKITKQKSSLDLLEDKLGALHPSKPLQYVEAAKWCLDQQHMDDLAVQLLEIAAKIDRKGYVDAEIALGDVYAERKKDRSAAAFCYARALAANPESDLARKRYLAVKDEAARAGRESTTRLLEGVVALQESRWADAALKLKAGRYAPCSGIVPSIMGMTVPQIVDYADRATPCKGCQGAGFVDCPSCKGTGSLSCKECKGTGQQAAAGVGGAMGTGVKTCSMCKGTGTLICPMCKPRRILRVRRSDGSSEDVSGGAIPANAAPGTYFWATSGGKVPCRLCRGKASGVDAVGTLDANRLSDLRTMLETVASGKQSLREQLGTRLKRVGVLEIDPEVAANDKVVYYDGRWMTLDEKRTVVPSTPAFTADRPSVDVDRLRKEATALQADASSTASFEATLEDLRGALAGEKSANSAKGAEARKKLFVTKFSPSPKEGPPGACTFVLDPREMTFQITMLQKDRKYTAQCTELAPVGSDRFLVPKTADLGDAPADAIEIAIYYTPHSVESTLVKADKKDMVLEFLRVVPKYVEVREAATGRVIAGW